LFGAGYVGLRALATGIPASVLLNPLRANAEEVCNATKPQYIVFSTSGAGDPSGCNVPGTYADPRMTHPPGADFQPVDFALGDTAVRAARIWSTLPASLLQRTCFFHHSTLTGSHSDHPKVNRVQGAVRRQEMLISLLAANLAPCLHTVQSEPIMLSRTANITSQGATLPFVAPSALKTVLAAPTDVFAKLQKLRDDDLDQLNALYKQSGTAAQRGILDRYALSQTQVRSLSTQLLNDLATIQDGDDGQTSVNTAAAVLLKMNAAPVVVMELFFGGDNHVDAGLADEIKGHTESIAAIADLYKRLAAYGMQDSVTFAMQNVFGRTFVSGDKGPASNGRTHHGEHHCSVFIGAGFRGSVIGNLVQMPSDLGGIDFRANAIDSQTGAGAESGDIKYEDTLASAAKTLATGVGLNASVVDDQITHGQTIKAALA